MEFREMTIEEKLGSEYSQHRIFEELKSYSEFYESLSFSLMSWSSMGTKAIMNLYPYAYSSIKGTIDSISEILKKGRINDAYALLRKYFDSTMINVYCNLYLDDNFSIDNLIVKQIDDWRQGTSSIPEYRVISRYIKESDKLKPINECLKKDDRYKKIRDRCNDNTHYNYFHNMILNDCEIHIQNRLKYLSQLGIDLKNLFIQHFSYIFYLNDHYFMSSDYIDYTELGMNSPDDSQYWVAPFIQDTFDSIIKIERPDLAEIIKRDTEMKIK